MNCFVRGFAQVSRKPRGPGLLDLALVHEDVEVADLAREVELVGDDHHRHAGLRKVAHDREHLADELSVECRGRLVEEHHLRVEAQRAGDRDALLLSARKLGGIVGGPAEQTDALQCAGGELLGLRPAHLASRNAAVARCCRAPSGAGRG